jgi:hypothetical protein
MKTDSQLPSKINYTNHGEYYALKKNYLHDVSSSLSEYYINMSCGMLLHMDSCLCLRQSL